MMTQNVQDLKELLQNAADFVGENQDASYDFAIGCLYTILVRYNSSNKRNILIKDFTILSSQFDIFRQTYDGFIYVHTKSRELSSFHKWIGDAEKKIEETAMQDLNSDYYIPQLIKIIADNEVNNNISLYGQYEVSLPQDMMTSWVNGITVKLLALLLNVVTFAKNRSDSNQEDYLSLERDLLKPWLAEYRFNKPEFYKVDMDDY